MLNSSMQLTSQSQLSLIDPVTSGGATSIDTSGTLSYHSDIETQGALTIHADAISNDGRILQRGTESLTLNSTGELRNTGLLFSAQAIHVAAGTVTDTQGEWQAARAINLDALHISLTSTTLNSDGSAQLRATAGDFDSADATLQAGADLVISSTADIHLQRASHLQAGQTTTLTGAAISTTASTVEAGGDLNVTTPGVLNNSGGVLAAGGALNLRAQSVINDLNGQVLATGPLHIVAEESISNSTD